MAKSIPTKQVVIDRIAKILVYETIVNSELINNKYLYDIECPCGNSERVQHNTLMSRLNKTGKVCSICAGLRRKRSLEEIILDESLKEKVACVICNKEMTYINNKHLASHNITTKQYKLDYPNSIMKSDQVTKKLSDRSIASNASKIGVKRSEKDIIAINEGIKKSNEINGPRISHNKGIPMTEEAKKHLSNLAKLRPPTRAKGFSLTQEVKDKISNTLTGRSIDPEITLRAIVTRNIRKKRGDYAGHIRKPLSQQSRDNISSGLLRVSKARRLISRQYMFGRILEAELTLLNEITDNNFILKCNKCEFEFTRGAPLFTTSKFRTEICNQCYPRSTCSIAETEIGDFVETFEPIFRMDREIIKPLELDIVIASKKIAIEYCGLWAHGELSEGIIGKHRMYHIWKREKTINEGYNLITIFEDEWTHKQEIVKSMILNKIQAGNTIYARKCKVVKITSEEGNAFSNINHIQGYGRANIYYGLKYEDKLVSVMSFSTNDISRKSVGWDINRYSNLLGYRILGGASKIFKQFVVDNNPEIVRSYADLRWGTGNVYEKCGFKKMIETGPGYWYFAKGGTKRFHRFSLRLTEEENKNKPEWEKNQLLNGGSTKDYEWQLRQEQGYNRIWDCGHAKWLWTKRKFDENEFEKVKKLTNKELQTLINLDEVVMRNILESPLRQLKKYLKV